MWYYKIRKGNKTKSQLKNKLSPKDEGTKNEDGKEFKQSDR